ncbi:hypothetical protein BVG16_26785 [Paenibacillus selenitireducens]|uniref:DUF5673 domain-containing protein n=1 Tax=Paenibacillus selenitireducens TaxID=1324314 RepID=A0A1T2X1G8_9BACL|nr:hypothetical protein [Paenibacillus selenitireducens]OPA73702.1 hypothetical protein BVG16_26785 [Paenibacillus selenitireducens]
MQNLPYMVIGSLLAAFVIYKVYTSFLARKQVGQILMSGTSDYKSTSIIVACLALVNGVFDFYAKNWLGWIVFFLCLCIALYLSHFVGQSCIGEFGLKVGNVYIPRERITSYRIVGKRVKEVELMVIGRDQGIRIRIHEKRLSKSLEDMLHQYVYRLERSET